MDEKLQLINRFRVNTEADSILSQPAADNIVRQLVAEITKPETFHNEQTEKKLWEMLDSFVRNHMQIDSNSSDQRKNEYYGVSSNIRETVEGMTGMPNIISDLRGKAEWQDLINAGLKARLSGTMQDSDTALSLLNKVSAFGNDMLSEPQYKTKSTPETCKDLKEEIEKQMFQDIFMLERQVSPKRQEPLRPLQLELRQQREGVKPTELPRPEIAGRDAAIKAVA